MKLDGDDHFPAKEEIPSSWEAGAPMKWQSDTNDKKTSIRQTILIATLVSLIIGALTTFMAFIVMSHQTSSSVALTVPLDNDHPDIPKEYIEEALASYSDKGPPPLNSTHFLEKRQHAVADPHKCIPGDNFVKRYCGNSYNIHYWTDLCTGDRRPYHAPGECPGSHRCLEHLDGPGQWPVVICQKFPPPHFDTVTRSGDRFGQYGVRPVFTPADGNNGQWFKIPIDVKNNIRAASISGYLANNDDGLSLVKPRNPMVAHVRGTEIQYCRNVDDLSRCTPTAVRNIKRADTLDFTFALSKDQVAVFVYSIWGHYE